MSYLISLNSQLNLFLYLCICQWIVVSFKLSENIWFKLSKSGEKVNQPREESAAQLNQSIELSHLLIQKC